MNVKEHVTVENGMKYFKKGDVFVYMAALLLVFVFVFFAVIYPRNAGDVFYVYFEGEKIFSASLKEDAEYLFYIDGNKGYVVPVRKIDCISYNVIEVKGGKVGVREADCPDGTCKMQGKKNWGEILCLPHKMRIVVKGEGLESDI